jgi:D-galacturonate reductase
MEKGDIASLFTPDDTHFMIAKATLERGIHLMVTKPVVKSLEEHQILVDIAKKNNVLLMVEVHKRFDPIYSDARQKISSELGEFGYFYSYMSQPKFQLDTFKKWAGISSDISYYLNSHHIDFHVWGMQGKARPISVTGIAATGQAKKILNRPCEDTITLTVQWENLGSENLGTAIYTSSWTDPVSDVHS